ncbi:hypothetical protein [Hymenobacter canadensis]|uniref:Bacterial transcription activator effector binding domain-containing protein n=1 Tax=Hymenobacter canadensis TaxID=2999067 RepID=A0ABY7LLA9_9BACT|nr:hypothetical protein [Hymenobacter canadensis]WBA41241.1 hypothetical protein O3303_15630 [Hymenobacter canadensis]
MNRIFLLLSLLLIVAAGVAYYMLGGLKKADVTLETTAQPIFLAGRYFEGPANSEQFGDLTREAYELRTSGKLRGTFGNLFYNDPAKASDNAKVFVGLILDDTVSQPLPPGYRHRVFAAGQRVLHARIEASYLVAPDKLYTGVKDYANQNNLTLQNIYLERFPTTGPVEVWAVVK